MTINKSQGQSIRYVGADLQTSECFSHGQLYVALSRVTSQRNLYIIGPRAPHYCTDGLLTNIVWKQVLLPRGEYSSQSACKANF